MNRLNALILCVVVLTTPFSHAGQPASSDRREELVLPAGRIGEHISALIESFNSADPAKVRDYLLSPEHPVGRFKATFFVALGYTRLEWTRLQVDLLNLCRSETAVLGKPNAFGQKYEVRATLEGPSGRRAAVVTVWVILVGEDFPRFVTAFPG